MTLLFHYFCPNVKCANDIDRPYPNSGCDVCCDTQRVVTRSASVGRSSLSWFVGWRWMAGRGNVVRKWYSELLREG